MSQAIGVLPLGVLVVMSSARFGTGALMWGVLVGVTNALGLVLFYRGLAQDSMSTVAPVTTLTSALVPSSVGWC
ncbi:hypothetical protein [Kineococcus aurantiacus]|uniref:Putative membrane protein n=1 Tax=Kineococcus aurantiacus TaxID=37633 RepID=A0A7Y9DQU5_9ACTN|nr:hypothetical protein [Kineococcus aurantiacus]NYD25136.1 putative membrane protein [Kineococcus aurantiacus]